MQVVNFPANAPLLTDVWIEGAADIHDGTSQDLSCLGLR